MKFKGTSTNQFQWQAQVTGYQSLAPLEHLQHNQFFIGPYSIILVFCGSDQNGSISAHYSALH